MLSKFIFAVCLSVLPAARAADDTYARAEHDRLLNILSGELFTEFKALGKKETVPLYFLQYELFDESLLRLSSFKGTEGTPEEFRYRNLDITARFNDYSFDNTHQIKRGYGQGATLLTSASMYYMQFRAVDDFNITLNSYMGSPRQPSESRVRYASVLPRYNDYTFDNTHQLKGGYYNKYENLLKYGYLPVDDAPVPLETAVWNIINAGVKDQYDKYIKVKANYDSTSAERDGAPDFSVSGPVKYYSVLKPQKINRAAWQAALDRTTAVFSEFPKALNGSAQFKYDLFSKYNADTDGSAVREDAGFGSVSVDVTALTDDGMLDVKIPKDTGYKFTIAVSPLDCMKRREVSAVKLSMI